MTCTETAPKLADDVGTHWPPVQHLIHKKDRPVKEGTIALCGTKLMGLDLGPMIEAKGPVCVKCLKFFKELTS